MFASNALIGLREGLEASLVVVILVAFLVKSGRRDALRYVWLGVGTAVGLAVLLGAILTFATEGLDDTTAETVTGIASLIAVCFVTGMVFWMRSAARSFAGELKGRMDRALDLGPYAVALVAFLGVGREGFEWSGNARIGRMAEWPAWTPPAAMLKRRPDLPRHMAGGLDNPLGARAMYLYSGYRDTMFRIHGSNEPWTIGQAVSSGCIRMLNADVEDLYSRVRVGSKVVVLR